jgi:predicted transcriptional regulator of viral defense system
MKKTLPRSSDFLSNLMAKGIYFFTTDQARKEFGTSARATIAVLWRLKKRELISTPYRGFHIIVPPEYRAFGCLPAEEFIPDLMSHLNSPYYVGLLSAAQFHGAAHQKPQYFQVVVPKNRSGIECGRVRVSFVARRNLQKVPTEMRNTARGILRLSTPEGTALDLMTYPEHGGGLGNVATVLRELSEKMQPKELVKTARQAGTMPYVQRLGYVLDRLGLKKLAAPLAEYVAHRAQIITPLVPSLPKEGMPKNEKWKLLINSQIEADL